MLAMALTRYSWVVTLFACLHGYGGLRFASYYGDHMVLQKGPERAVLWGYGLDGAQVTVSLTGPVTQKTPAVNVTKGMWRVTLDPVEAGGPYTVTAALEQGINITLTDVLFGDIWLCGGQSNMEFEVSKIFNASEELALAAKYPHVRIFMASLVMSETVLTDLARVDIPWSIPTAMHLSHFSAVCWLFGRHMYETLKYPVGLVESCWGGTPVEAWSSPRALHQCGLMEATGSKWIGLGDWRMEFSPKDKNSVLWNAMIHPFLPMTLKGAIWYQGEANAAYHQDQYNCSFPAMIDDWRMSFHQGSGQQTAADFPFGFVQLCTYQHGSSDESFPNIRWHQTADIGFVPNQRMKRTFMAVTLDLPDEKSPYGTIHPRDKQDVAHRLTLGARAVAYGEKGVAFQGPFPKRIFTSESYLSIIYDQTVSVAPSKHIFEICCSTVRAPCGPQSTWVPAPIMHWGPTTVQVSTVMCQPIDKVAGLRYAWRDWPCEFKACPIYSASGVLPAPPFEVNRWPGWSGH